MRRISSKKDYKDIIVPAGTFKECVKNTYTSIGGRGLEDFKIVSFYAKDIGLIKEVQYDSKGDVTYSLVLVSFKLK